MSRTAVAAFMDRASTRNFIIGVIIFNAIILGLETSKAVMGIAGPLITLLDRICLAVFVVEIAGKLYAHGLRFFRSGWNLFDFDIVGEAQVPREQDLSVPRARRI